MIFSAEQLREMADAARSGRKAYEAHLWGNVPKERRLHAIILTTKMLEPGALEPDVFGDALIDAWSLTENPNCVGTTYLVDVFRRAGFLGGAAGDQSGPPVEPPTEPITIYRGIRAGGVVRRMAWTTAPPVARFFALRKSLIYGTTGEIWRATIKPDGVLAILHGRNEAEVVVDPRRLRGVALVESGLIHPGSSLATGSED